MVNELPEAGIRVVRRWRYVIYSIALGLPLLAFGATAAIALLGSVPAGVRDSVLKDMRWWIVGYPFAVIFFNWPFFVLAWIVGSKIRARWPNLDRINLSAAGALMGMSVPYALGYWEWPGEMTSGASDAGQGVGIFLPLLGWFGGAILATIGWFVGAWLGPVRDKPDVAP